MASDFSYSVVNALRTKYSVYLVIHYIVQNKSLFLLFLEMDDEDCERRRMECLDEMSNLEKQFTDLKDQ